ncbi:hypothetical protein DDZ13_11320 [Coraliomargarita sinensis]|uniref:Lipid/polyisoprenoid-binding YceI-like domain-containing protein n=1 Tax=Coraliomargarita sinensis TaxID=2174842 RepID=A0A317ZH55_9BACT|nr:YceI family protein [Coraliomargarita sinensis]PXA03563.1 hypothetical protein DDZ13_11320 [Coraliomargarita sinensis]
MKNPITGKNIPVFLLLALAAAVSPFLSAAQAEGSEKLVFSSESEDSGKILITGTSSLHDWEIVGKNIAGSLTVTTTKNGERDLEVSLPVEAQVKIPVKSLESGKGIMDKKMFKALEGKKHENVLFVLDSLEIVEADPDPEKANLQVLNVKAKGKLSIAGETRWIQFPAAIDWDAAKKLVSVSGETDIRMTDFGIDPPTALLGTLKTGNEVKVSFSWTPKLQ